MAATVASMISLLTYGSGLRFNRCEGRQQNLEIPLSASPQWEIVSAAVPQLEPVFAELLRQASNTASGCVCGRKNHAKYCVMQIAGLSAQGIRILALPPSLFAVYPSQLASPLPRWLGDLEAAARPVRPRPF